jgi:hypothetical protein
MTEKLSHGPLSTSTAHLCVDMQNLFAEHTPWHTPWMERVRPVVAKLARHRPVLVSGQPRRACARRRHSQTRIPRRIARARDAAIRSEREWWLPRLERWHAASEEPVRLMLGKEIKRLRRALGIPSDPDRQRAMRLVLSRV